MKIVSVDISGGLTKQALGSVPVDASIQDIVVVVEHQDGTQGTYLVQSREDLKTKVAQYEQWASELASLQAMVEP